MDQSHDPSTQNVLLSRVVGKKISWDEAVIAEHDKVRGTREKISEPNTPYHLSTSEHSSDSENLDTSNSEFSVQSYMGRDSIAEKKIIQQVSSRLNQLQQSNDPLNECQSDFRFQGDENSSPKYNYNLNFKERRKKHYDEYHRLKISNISDEDS
ncbi:protein phosphatase inhibitor 2 (I2) [Babesia microti strain RI]|uniref:Protein phosphatase inhibitor 2 (I2) n=1 Tax=Babesia microti (strain RI) TaxID=1133968 RepID=I7I8Z7_BABMR|nr:protein phosphatase inhibitor 2 (I2) [Babesia microti strain RI]CCF73958.1 protein phosphatase inhibitor 2 (I2) [Babesia microti strain RI]|eukprot:XP_012648567.1 protein phosphatase inhibitor 2 (I2) [Babesia microti strain RI]